MVIFKLPEILVIALVQQWIVKEPSELYYDSQCPSGRSCISDNGDSSRLVSVHFNVKGLQVHM